MNKEIQTQIVKIRQKMWDKIDVILQETEEEILLLQNENSY